MRHKAALLTLSLLNEAAYTYLPKRMCIFIVNKFMLFIFTIDMIFVWSMKFMYDRMILFKL